MFFALGTVHKPHGLLLAILNPPPSTIAVLRGFPRDPPPQKKTRGIFFKIIGRHFTSQENTSYLLYFMKEIRHNVDQLVYQSRTGKENEVANKEKGRRGLEKMRILKTPSLMCRVSPRFKQNATKKDHVVFCRTPPSPTVVLRGFIRNAPLNKTTWFVYRSLVVYDVSVTSKKSQTCNARTIDWWFDFRDK